MKTKLFTFAALLLTIVFISSCKKEDTNSFRSKITGRWQLNKIERRVYKADGTVASTITTPYTSSDYIDFKNNENDELEMNLGAGNRFMGNYVVLFGQTFNISLSNKLLYCDTDNLTDNTFQFTGTVDQANPKVTETYYLQR